MGSTTNTYKETGGTSGRLHVRRWGVKQSPPIDFTMPLPQLCRSVRLKSGFDSMNGGELFRLNQCSTWQDPVWGPQSAGEINSHQSFATSDGLPTGREWNLAYARAYAKWLGEIYTKAEMLTNYAERAESVAMLSNRLTQIYRGATQLKRGDFRGFVKTFGIKPKSKHKDLAWTRPRQFSGLWLEYWFGWAPVINDIYTATKNYGTPPKMKLVKQGSAQSFEQIGFGASGQVHAIQTGKVIVRICGRVEVTSESLFEQNRLGLLNPAKTALDIIPFSWLAGWFMNLSQVLGQYTDFAGLRLLDATVSTRTKWEHTWTCSGRGTWTQEFNQYTRFRANALPRVKLGFSLPNGLSITRGATLASLITQLFAPHKG